jgi:nitroreductase
VELRELLARRRMVRSFDATPVDQDWLDECCRQALWSPTAGNSAGVRLHTIGPSNIAGFFGAATDEGWRESARRAPGLQRAGGAVLVTCRPQDYLERYGESDKRSSGLDEKSEWPVPYWFADAAMAAMALLLLIEEGGWQATLWGNFRNDEVVLDWADVRDEQLFAIVLVGRGDGNDVTSSSLQRDVPSRASRVRRVRP